MGRDLAEFLQRTETKDDRRRTAFASTIWSRVWCEAAGFVESESDFEWKQLISEGPNEHQVLMLAARDGGYLWTTGK